MAAAEPKLLWTPSPEWIERTTLTRYQAWLEEKHDLRFESYHDLWRWSVFDLEAFWSSLVEFFGVRFSEAAERVLGSEAMPGAKWFPGSRLSYAEHMFAGKDPDALAIQHASESRELASMTWGELRRRRRRSPRGCGRRAWARATGSPRTCRTSPRRSRRCSRARRSARCGRRRRPSSACGAWSTGSRRSSPRCCWPSTATATAARSSTAREAVERIAGEIPSLARVVRLGYLDGSGWEDGFLGLG